MRFARLLISNSSLKCTLRWYCARYHTSRVIRIVNLNDEEDIKLSFRFNNSSTFNIKAPKHEDVSILLKRIKLMTELQQKREEMKREIINKYSTNSFSMQVAVETVEECADSDVCLIGNCEMIDERTQNIDAWSQASVLKIGDLEYEVQFNSPSVINMTLPDYIVSCCILRPHFHLECASLEDSTFMWYRSAYFDTVDSENIRWVKVGEGFHYMTTPDDVGCHLKVVCTPGQGTKIGPDFTAISNDVVEAGPAVYPFEERHAYTPTVNDISRFRCVSYNTLANMYVEKRKFPYTSRKARDVYYRKQLLLREILGYNSDVICLQEIQDRVFEYDFYPVLKKAGFDGFYMKKGGRRHEGLATFFRTSKFRVLKNEGVLLNQIVKKKNVFVDLLTKVSGNYKDMSKLLAQDTALQAVLLENVENPAKKILVANTHLYSNKNTPEVRLIQSALCVYYLEYLLKTKTVDSDAVLFCGDFNSLPNSEAYNFLISGNFQCCPSWKNNNINSDLSEDSTLRHNLCLESACGTPDYTNYTEEFQGCLDYIFYSKKSIEVTDIVPMPRHEAVTAEVGLPSENFPSDHIALVCTLKWKVDL